MDEAPWRAVVKVDQITVNDDGSFTVTGTIQSQQVRFMGTPTMSDDSDPPRYMTVAEVAELLRTPESTVRYWRHRGEGPPSTRLGRRVVYAREDVEQWLADRR